MRYHQHCVTAAAIVAGVIGSSCAQATVRAGNAVIVVREVLGSLSGQSWDKKVTGDDVYENEFIRTAAESSAGISFVDETDIKIGPSATMKIDRAVLNSNKSDRALIVSVEGGAMRWNSGTSISSAYQVKTTTAIIRVEGTTFDLFVESQRTTVVLRRGRIEVCSIDAPQRCRTVSQRNDMIVATPSNLEGPRQGGLGPSEFADRCLSADVMTRCVIMASLSPAQRPSPNSGGVTPTHRVQSEDVPSGPRVVYQTQTSPIYHGGEGGSRVTTTRNCYPYRGRVVCRSSMSPSYQPSMSPSRPPRLTYYPRPAYRPVPAGAYRPVSAGAYRPVSASTLPHRSISSTPR